MSCSESCGDFPYLTGSHPGLVAPLHCREDGAGTRRKVSGDQVVWGAIVATVVVVVLCWFYPQFVNYGDQSSYGDQVGWGWQVGGVAIWLADGTDGSPHEKRRRISYPC